MKQDVQDILQPMVIKLIFYRFIYKNTNMYELVIDILKLISHINDLRKEATANKRKASLLNDRIQSLSKPIQKLNEVLDKSTLDNLQKLKNVLELAKNLITKSTKQGTITKWLKSKDNAKAFQDIHSQIDNCMSTLQLDLSADTISRDQAYAEAEHQDSLELQNLVEKMHHTLHEQNQELKNIQTESRATNGMIDAVSRDTHITHTTLNTIQTQEHKTHTMLKNINKRLDTVDQKLEPKITVNRSLNDVRQSPSPLEEFETSIKFIQGLLETKPVGNFLTSLWNQVVNPGYRHYRFIFTSVKDNLTRDAIQLSRIILFNDEGEEITYRDITNATNPGGISPENEHVTNLFDEDMQTKWLDFNITQNGYSVVQIELTNSTLIKSYTFMTANDYPSRDPAKWWLEGSENGKVWNVCDEQTILPPEKRYTLYPKSEVRDSEEICTWNYNGKHNVLTHHAKK